MQDLEFYVRNFDGIDIELMVENDPGSSIYKIDISRVLFLHDEYFAKTFLKGNTFQIFVIEKTNIGNTCYADMCKIIEIKEDYFRDITEVYFKVIK